MASFGPKLTGISLSVLGWVLSVITCALPMWTVTSFTDEYNEDRNMSRFYEHSDQEAQTLRPLSVVAIIVGMLGVFIFMVGAKCTSYKNERVKARLMASSGGMFITAALVQLVPVFWTAHTIALDYYFFARVKLGVTPYLGWAASVLMLIGGSILCCICPPEEDIPTKYNLYGLSNVEYSATSRSTAQSSDNKRDEV